MNAINPQLIEFINRQRLMVIATTGDDQKPWVCNVYYSSDEELNFYIISPTDTAHSIHVQERPEVAFSIAWYDENNLGNRKAVQGKGIFELLSGVPANIAALNIHHKKYPEWKDMLSWDNMVKKVIKSRVYKLTPTYMKFWNDEVYGDEEVKEFIFNK